jgi:predicted NUDIX family NTP pyrophosphohydrolase
VRDGTSETDEVARVSAGLLLYRRSAGPLEVFLVHPGGPFWARKDAGAWSIPKGEIDPEEDHLAAARRELTEETGLSADGAFLPLTPIRQSGGKVVHAFALESDCDLEAIRSNSFEIEWPPHSGQKKSFPEIDRADWFPLDQARQKINPAQIALLDELQTLLA